MTLRQQMRSMNLENRCPICDGLSSILHAHPDLKNYPVLNNLRNRHDMSSLPCPACKPESLDVALAEANERDVKYYLGRSGVPERFHDVSIDTFVAAPEALRTAGLKGADIAHRLAWKEAICAYLGDISGNLNDGKGLTLTGSVGTGKTLALYIVAGHIVRECRQFVTLVPERTIFESVKETFGYKDGQSEGEVLKRFENADVLMIDDFGVRKATEWVTDIYHSIIDSRWDAGKPTFVSSNLPVSELLQIYPRQMDRLKKNVAIEMVGGSLRGTELEK